MTDTNPIPRYIENKSGKGFNDRPTYSVYAARTAAHHIPYETTSGYNLARLLATYLNDNTANGVVFPSDAQVMYMTGMNRQELVNAQEELERSGWFSIVRSTSGEVQQYKFLFMEWMVDNARKLKRQRSSLNHAKFEARYNPMKSQDAKAIQSVATESIVPVFDDLGYNYYKKEVGIVPPHQIRNGDRLAKVCHSALFHHEKLQTGDPDVWAEIFNMNTLPEDWTSNPKDAVLTFDQLLRKFPNLTPDSIIAAIDDINEAGWWIAELGTNDEGDAIRMTPTHKLHATVWDFDNHAGGKNNTSWEVSNGFTHDNYRIAAAADESAPTAEVDDATADVNADGKGNPFLCPPPLGYHYVYLLRSHQTGIGIIVGETTQALNLRRNQHAQVGTNDEANDEIFAVVRDPEDYLEIVHLMTVHNSVCNQKEMGSVEAGRAAGHPLKNKITFEGDNWKTIKVDSRLPQAVWRKGIDKDEHARLKAIQKKALNKCLETHDGNKVLFALDKFPPVPAHGLELLEQARQAELDASVSTSGPAWGEYHEGMSIIPWEVEEEAETVPTVITVAPADVQQVHGVETVEEPVVDPEAKPRAVTSDIPAPVTVLRTGDAIPFPAIWQRAPRSQKAS